MNCRDDRSANPSRGGQNQVHHHPTPAGRSRGCLTGKDGGKVFMFRATIVRGRVTVPITCSASPPCCRSRRRLPNTESQRSTAASLSTRTPRRMPPPGNGWSRRPRSPGPMPRHPTRSCTRRHRGGGRAGAHRPRQNTASKEALANSTGSVDPATGEWTDPVPGDPALLSGVDPVTGEWVDPATAKEVEPAPTDPMPVAPAPPTAPAPPNTLGSRRD